MANAVNVAAVGLGRWAHQLATQYTELDNVNLVTCFTRTPGKRDEFADKFGCDQDETLEAVLDREDIEAVVVTVPNDKHADVVEQAADAGKHVFVEKPISIDIEDARRIEDAVERNSVTFLTGHSCRRVGGIRKMKELIEKGDIGDVSHIEAEWANERGLEIGADNWRGNPNQAPGGPLIQLGVHQIDNLQYLLGPIKSVFTYGKSMYTEVENMTMTQTVLEFESGQQAYLGANWTSPGVFFINVYGTEGVMFYDLDFANWSNSEDTDKNSELTLREFKEWTEDPDERQLRDTDVDMPIKNHLRDEFDEFAQAIRTDDVEPEIGARDAMRNVAVVLAAQRSARENRPVGVDEIIENA